MESKFDIPSWLREESEKEFHRLFDLQGFGPSWQQAVLWLWLLMQDRWELFELEEGGQS